MMKVQNRAELAVIGGNKPAPPPIEKPAPESVKVDIAALAKAIQDSAEQTQQSMMMLAQAMMESRPQPRAQSLVADVERDEDGKMLRVRISIER